jgi:geranylgeranyl diphosphate synthase, type II
MEKFDLKNYINGNKKLIDSKIDEFLKLKKPEILWESMRYTSLLDGKRLRPLLVLESTKACGGNIEDSIPTACAIEMLHAQSLIHDDLPCMDNDDFRRGKPTNHKVYGEALAILAGDALLAYAPYVISEFTPKNVKPEILLKVLNEFLKTAGPECLIGGQVVDIESENKEIDSETLKYIHTHKTGDIITFSAKAGAIISGADEKTINIFEKYGRLLGFSFQIADDILDVTSSLEELGKTPNKDLNSNKATYVKIFGLENSKKEVKTMVEEACILLEENNLATPALIGLAKQVYGKIKEN